MEMRGKLVEADFEKDELVFKMAGRYHAHAGLFVIMSVEELEQNYERRTRMDNLMYQMRKDSSEVP